MTKTRSFHLPFAILLASGLAGCVQQAAPSGQPPGPQAQNSTCIEGYNIQDTDRPNDSTIVLHMKDGTTYVNHTVGKCPGLASDPEGFTWSPTDSGNDQFCSNLVSIRLNTTKEVCLLGAFELQPK